MDGFSSGPTSAVGRMAPRGWVQVAVLVLFFLSGACGLVYEVVWMRMLTLVLGATAIATSTILASFFSGLALGSLVFGRVVDRGRNPLRVYAALEAGIGACAFLMPFAFAGVTGIYVWASQQLGPDFVGLHFLRFALAFVVLLVPSTLMGGTLPVMVPFFARSWAGVGRQVGRLYAVNTFGAVVGAFSAGFFLILILGVNESAYLAGTINLTIAAIVMGSIYAGGLRPTPAIGVDDPSVPEDGVLSATDAHAPEDGAFAPALARLALVAAAVSGFSALALEVLWTRALVFFLDNSTHAFTTILTTFLLGIALGSLVIARFVDGRRRLLTWLGVIEVLIGVSAIAAIPILAHSTPVFERVVGASIDPSLAWKWTGMRFVQSLSVMLAPSLLMGMALPLITRIYARSIQGLGSATGTVFSANTAGGVVGSLLAGFVLIPVFGVQRSVALVAMVSVTLGGVILASDPFVARRTRFVFSAVAMGLFLTLGGLYVSQGPVMMTSYYEGLQQHAVLSYEEGIGATVKVFEDEFGDRIISINGFPVAGSSPEALEVQRPLAHLPLLLSAATTPRVNIIGFGAGGTSFGVMQHDVGIVDCVELVPEVLNAAPWFDEVNHGVLKDPGFNLVLGDGRNHMLTTATEYDVISVDATSPKMAGNGSLYTIEFYRLLRERLSPQGLAVQWLPIHLLSEAEVRMIVNTFRTVFPHTNLWYTPFRLHIIVMGSMEPLQIDFGRVTEKFKNPDVRQELAGIGVTDPIDLLGWFLMGEEAVGRYVRGARINSDNHPYLEFTPAMAYFMSDRFLVGNLEATFAHRESVLPLLTNLPDADLVPIKARVRRRFEATHFSISGDILLSAGRRDEAVFQYQVALEVDPTESNWLNLVWNSRGPSR